MFVCWGKCTYFWLHTQLRIPNVIKTRTFFSGWSGTRRASEKNVDWLRWRQMFWRCCRVVWAVAHLPHSVLLLPWAPQLVPAPCHPLAHVTSTSCSTGQTPDDINKSKFWISKDNMDNSKDNSSWWLCSMQHRLRPHRRSWKYTPAVQILWLSKVNTWKLPLFRTGIRTHFSTVDLKEAGRGQQIHFLVFGRGIQLENISCYETRKRK